MVVISRKQGEAICIPAYDAAGQPVVIEVLVAKAATRVKIGLTMPRQIPFRRKELPELPKEEAA